MKPFWKSKTLWFNAVTLLVTISGVGLQYVDAIGLTEAQAAFAGMALTILNTLGNMYLRTITNTGVHA